MLLLLHIGLSSKRKWDFNQGLDFTVKVEMKPRDGFQIEISGHKKVRIIYELHMGNSLPNKYHPSAFLNIPLFPFPSAYSLYSHGSHCIVVAGGFSCA